MARIINWVPFHWAQSARQQPHYPVDNWSVLPFISTLNAIKCHYWLSNLPSALGSHCLLRQGSAPQIRGECSVRCNQVGIASHCDIFHLTFKHCLVEFGGWMWQISSIGYQIWCPECVTLNRAVWKRWVYHRFTHIKLFSVEHEWLWIPKKAVLARWWQRQYPNVEDTRNEGQSRITLSAQVSKPRLSLNWCSLITSMQYVLPVWLPNVSCHTLAAILPFEDKYKKTCKHMCPMLLLQKQIHLL